MTVQRQAPRTPPLPRQREEQVPPAGGLVSPEIQEAARDTARSIVLDAVAGRRPYAKMAFANPYNLALLAGGIAASLLTLNPVPALLALGGEALWLLWAPDSKRLRHVLWDPKFDKLRKAIEAEERKKKMATLRERSRERVEALVRRREEIERLAAHNPSFTGELLRAELFKADRLVDAFIDMALTTVRYESYQATVDPAALERDVERFAESVRRGTPGDPRTEIAQKNLAVVLKRQERLRDIQTQLGIARGQLDLIENSFQLIADQIVTMQSPQELSGQLDELLESVETIRQSARDTEKLLESTGSFTA